MRSMTAAILFLALTAISVSGCKQEEGERCQMSSDCGEGLTCCIPSGAEGTCLPPGKCGTTGDGGTDGGQKDFRVEMGMDAGRDSTSADAPRRDLQVDSTIDAPRPDAPRPDLARPDQRAADQRAPDLGFRPEIGLE